MGVVENKGKFELKMLSLRCLLYDYRDSIIKL